MAYMPGMEIFSMIVFDNPSFTKGFCTYCINATFIESVRRPQLFH